MRHGRIAAALLTMTMTFGMADPASAAPQTYPGQQEGDVVVRDFRLTGGERLEQAKLHYTTLGTPHRGADGEIDNAVLVLHGTTGTGRAS